MLNHPAATRRLAIHTVLLQLAAAALIGLAFLVQGRSSALPAALAALVAAAGTAVVAARGTGLAMAGPALLRLLAATLLKWVVVVTGLGAILIGYRLPPLPALIGFTAAMAIHLLAFRFKG